ncbi:MAG: bifunctional riboflavin kinase/FAD synthetase [Chloroflexi bacterium]|nr:bifunctional riboflavin kinase/FAD synthetase [Chloroflexota bacterium]
MGVEEELAQVSPARDMLLTIGVFDGVHLGHRHLISQLKNQVKERDLLSGVVTFRKHPREVVSTHARLRYLTTIDQRIRLLKNEGVDEVVALSFTPEVARLSAREFVGLLQKYLRMCGLVIGPDFALGREREGSAETLRRLGREMGFTVTVVPPMKIGSDVVSSTAIRNALAGGDMKKVRSLTGRLFSLEGRVVSGVGRGRQLGFPTANIDVDPQQALPADGVYATRAYIDDKAYQAVTNIGKRPTFSGEGRTVEVYILDFNGDVYASNLKIDVVERLRGEKKFASAEELKKQIAEDIKQGRAILGSV